MNDQGYWERFVTTGNVYDYLNYTACTKEDSYEWMTYGISSRATCNTTAGTVAKEGELEGGKDNGDRDGPADNAHRWIW